ncbi:MAG: hypothetical protein MK195_10040 [Acidimicrobiales bacterium]|nr:hypothetical protein [Acidimicrobiales bacterium]
MATLAEIRAKLLEKEQRTGGSFQSDNAIYAFWNIPENSTATLRFLPDLDETNTFFWKERQMIRLSFPGIKGQDESRSVTVQVPCVEMWGDACPVHAEIRPWFKDPSLEDEGRKYWKKRSYIFQGFVTDNPWGDDTPPENPIRRFVINPSIYKIISAALMDPDFPEIPTDFEAGTDFKLTKTQKGQYADYSTSNWARRERSLDQTERDAIQTNGLFNLNDYMPKRPNNEEIKVIFEMFESSVAGELYDPERFGSYYTPQGVQLTNFNKSAPSGPSKAPETPKPVVAETTTTPTEEKVETETETEGGEKPSADQILKMIRERKAQ